MDLLPVYKHTCQHQTRLKHTRPCKTPPLAFIPLRSLHVPAPHTLEALAAWQVHGHAKPFSHLLALLPFNCQAVSASQTCELTVWDGHVSVAGREQAVFDAAYPVPGCMTFMASSSNRSASILLPYLKSSCLSLARSRARRAASACQHTCRDTVLGMLASMLHLDRQVTACCAKRNTSQSGAMQSFQEINSSCVHGKACAWQVKHSPVTEPRGSSPY